MTMQRDRLADIQYVGASAASLYTNPASTKTYIAGITLFNGNTTTETVKLYLVPDSSGAAGTAAAANQFFEQTLAAKETLIIEWKYPPVLKDTGDSLQAVTTTASKVTAILHGDIDQ